MDIALVTGANRGIGLELARYYAGEGWHVIGACREASDELREVAGQVVEDVDITSEASIESLARNVGSQTIKLLINNAGMLQDEQLGELDFDSMRTQMEVNAYGPLRVVEALLSNMDKGSKIANITSRMGSIADNDSGGRYGYRASKAALNAFGRSLAMDLRPRKIAVAQLHPGYVQTRMVHFGGHISAQKAARGLAERIDNLSMENTGSFWHSSGEELPW